MPQRVPPAWHSEMQLPGKLLLSAAALLLLSLAFRFYRNRSPPPPPPPPPAGKIPPGEQRENRDGDGSVRRRRRKKGDGGEESGNGLGMRQAALRGERSFPRREEEEEEEEGEEVGSELGLIPRTGRELGRRAGWELGMKSAGEAGAELGSDPGSGTGKEPGEEPGKELGKEPGREPGRDIETGKLGSQPGSKSGSRLGIKPGNDPGSEAGRELVTEPGNKWGSEPGIQLGNKLGDKPGVKAGSELGSGQGREAGSKLGSEPGVKAGAEAGSEPGIQLGSEPGSKAGILLGREPGIPLGSEPGSKAGIPLGREPGVPLGSELGIPLGSELGSHDPGAVTGAQSSPAERDPPSPSSPGIGDARTERDGCSRSAEQDPSGAGRSREGSTERLRTLSVTSNLGLLLAASEAGSDTSYCFSSVAKIQVEENFIPERRDKDGDSPPGPGLRGKVYDYFVQSVSESVSRRTSLPFVPAGTSQRRGERGQAEPQSPGATRGEKPALGIPGLNPASGIPDPNPASGTADPNPASGISGPNSASGTTDPNPASGISDPNPASGTADPNPASGIPGPNPASGIPDPNPALGISGPNSASGTTDPNPASGIPGPNPASGIPGPNPALGIPDPNPASGISGPNPASGIPDPNSTLETPDPSTSTAPNPALGTPDPNPTLGVPDPNPTLGVPDPNPTLETLDPSTSTAPNPASGIPDPNPALGIPDPNSTSETPDPDTSTSPPEDTSGTSPHPLPPGEVPAASPTPSQVLIPGQVHLGNCGEVLRWAKARRLRAPQEAALRVMSRHLLQVLRSPDIYGRLNAAERDRLPALRSLGRPRLVVADVPQAEPGDRHRHRRGRLCYYDEDGDCWRQLCQLPAEVSGRGCALCPMFNYLFLAPGWEGEGRARRPSRRLLCYDPLAGGWRDLCPLRQARPRCRLVALDGHLYAIGGECLATVERYDPRRDRWAFAAALPGDAFAVAHAAAACGGDIYVAGGTLRPLLLRYDARGDSWAASPALGDQDGTAELVGAHGFLYRFQLRRGAGAGEVTVTRCSASAGLWYRCDGRPLPAGPAELRCAALGGLVHCLGRGFHLRFLADPVSPRFGAKELRPFPEPHGSLLPAVLVLPEEGAEPARL